MDGEIHVEELRGLLEDGADVAVVDIRPPAAFRRGHIPDSHNVPLAELVDRIERLDPLADAERIVTVCPHGKSSVQAARLIASYEGIDTRVQSLAEGLDGWDGPVESGSPADSDSPTDRGSAPF